MKICAVTMVYRDYWALSQWYAHYSRHLGANNLFVVSHGDDPRIRSICPDASVITVPRDSVDGFDRVRWRLLNDLQASLGHVYDWVLRTDADELICLDPECFSSFEELFRDRSSEAVFALGFNLIEHEGDKPVGDAPVFDMRRNAVFSGHYSKAFAGKHGKPLARHGVRLMKRQVEAFRFDMPRGVYLAHIKYACGTALADANIHRESVARRAASGGPGRAWQEAEEEAQRVKQDSQAKKLVAWPEASHRAYAKLSTDPVRRPNERLVRARSLRFRFRTELPEWFKEI